MVQSVKSRQQDFIYNALDELTELTDSLKGKQLYHYDAEGRLLSYQKQSNDHVRQSHVESYIYDAADNLLETQHHSNPIMDNRLVHYQSEYYNDWGELKTIHHDDSKRVFTFNDSGELIESYHQSDTADSHGVYDYDALGRRIRKTVETTKNGITITTKTKFVWMGMQMVEESVDRSGQEDHFIYIYRPDGSYEPLAQIKNGDDVFYYQNHINGSPNQLVDIEGNHLWEQEQTAWGKTLCDENSTLRQAHQPLRFQGQYFDEETGLHYNTFRYYNPHCGRFISQDPIGLNGGFNLYQYAPNPISWIDPWGWKPTSRAEYRKALRDMNVPTSRPRESHEYVYDGSTENRTVYDHKDVNEKTRHVVKHENDRSGRLDADGKDRGAHYHTTKEKHSDGTTSDPHKKGKYAQGDGHYPEDKDGFGPNKNKDC